jgi:hypothetical protein
VQVKAVVAFHDFLQAHLAVFLRKCSTKRRPVFPILMRLVLSPRAIFSGPRGFASAETGGGIK